jgi:hypothetical protein
MLIDLKSYVIDKVPSDQYYTKRFPRWNRRVKSNVSCVFHKRDASPSLSINLRNGGAHCFASSCGASIGNIVHFEAALLKVEAGGKWDDITADDEINAARQLYSEFIRPIVPNETLAAFRSGLDQKLRSTFTRATGITNPTIEAFGVGYDQRTRRYTIPIQNQFGDVVNVRFYRPKSARSKGDIKYFSLVENKDTPDEVRYGNVELFPWQRIRSYTAAKPVFFMASEKESQLACQLNLQALCSTAGEGSWLEDWLEFFTGYDVGVVFDDDEGGHRAAEKIVATLQQVAHNVVALKLPFSATYRGDRDFDDWILSKNGNQFALLKLLQDSIEAKVSATSLPSSLETVEATEGAWDLPKFYDVDIHELSEIRTNTDLLNHCVYTRGIIAAVASKSFDVPFSFTVKTKTGISEITLPVGRELVSFVGASDTDVIATLGRHIGADIKEWKQRKYIPISEVELVPIADVATESEGRYTVQRCFVLGKSIESNTPYELTVIPTTLTKSQEKVCIIVHATEVSRAIDQWVFSEDETKSFETFRPTDGQSVDEKLAQIADELAANHTKIYSRTDWHIVALLTWFCPLAWNFPGETDLQRGWLNTLAIGDTQTGKSKVVATLQRTLRLGDIVNAENCTFVGLVGGAIKTGSGQMMLRWGRIPLCDRKLVIIEELSGLSITEISNMSEVRSRGIARLDKGGLASQTPARTRLIALSNVRPMLRNLAQYLSGVKAIQELIGHPEDISRFDLIVTLVDSEVSSDVINSPLDETTDATFTPEQLRRLCQFAWSLKPHQIRFSDDAYISCLEWTKKMQETYHPSVPIFKAASGRLLLARIGAAIATLQFSWDGENLTVEETHIEAAVNLLRSLYDKPSFGYLEYSKQMQDRESLKETSILEQTVKTTLNVKIRTSVFENLIHAAKFTRDELAATGSMQLFQADDLVGAMLRSRVIRKGEANTWEITKPGHMWMSQQINGNGERRS